MGALFNTLIHQPLVNLLALLYDYATFRNMGLAIIFLTLLIRFILFPIFYKTAKHQKLTQALQPHIRKIQERHKDDRMKQSQAMLALYKEHGINPMTPFLLLLLQFPILIALYNLFRSGFTADTFKILYPFVQNPGTVDSSFLWINLNSPSLLIAGLAAALQYVQSRLLVAKPEEGRVLTSAERMGRNMIFAAPVITLFFLINIPSAIGLYWLTGIVFTIFQQMLVNKHISEKHPRLNLQESEESALRDKDKKID